MASLPSIPIINITAESEEDEFQDMAYFRETLTDVEDLGEPEANRNHKSSTKLLIRIDRMDNTDTDMEYVAISEGEDKPRVIKHRKPLSLDTSTACVSLIEENSKIMSLANTNEKLPVSSQVTNFLNEDVEEDIRNTLTDIENIELSSCEEYVIYEIDLSSDTFCFNHDVLSINIDKTDLNPTPSPMGTPVSSDEELPNMKEIKYQSFPLTVPLHQFHEVTDVEMLSDTNEKYVKKKSIRRCSRIKENITDVEDFSDRESHLMLKPSLCIDKIKSFQQNVSPVKDMKDFDAIKSDMKCTSYDEKIFNAEVSNKPKFLFSSRPTISHKCSNKKNHRRELVPLPLSEVNTDLESGNSADADILLKVKQHLAGADMTDEEILTESEGFGMKQKEIQLPPPTRELILIQEDEMKPVVIITSLRETQSTEANESISTDTESIFDEDDSLGNSGNSSPVYDYVDGGIIEEKEDIKILCAKDTSSESEDTTSRISDAKLPYEKLRSKKIISKKHFLTVLNDSDESLTDVEEIGTYQLIGKGKHGSQKVYRCVDDQNKSGSKQNMLGDTEYHQSIKKVKQNLQIPEFGKTYNTDGEDTSYSDDEYSLADTASMISVRKEEVSPNSRNNDQTGNSDKGILSLKGGSTYTVELKQTQRRSTIGLKFNSNDVLYLKGGSFVGSNLYTPITNRCGNGKGNQMSCGFQR